MQLSVGAPGTAGPLPSDVQQSPLAANSILDESFTRPNVGADGEPLRETKKPKKYHFVRGKSGGRS